MSSVVVPYSVGSPTPIALTHPPAAASSGGSTDSDIKASQYQVFYSTAEAFIAIVNAFINTKSFNLEQRIKSEGTLVVNQYTHLVFLFKQKVNPANPIQTKTTSISTLCAVIISQLESLKVYPEYHEYKCIVDTSISTMRGFYSLFFVSVYTPPLRNSVHAVDPVTLADVPSNYVIKQFLGEGAYASVVELELKKDFKEKSLERVALKKSSRIFDNIVCAPRLLREIKILRQLNHPNIVRFHGVVAPETKTLNFNSISCLFDFYECDLHKLFTSNQLITDNHVQYFMYQLLSGLHYLHSHKVIHRDIKPSNILINGNCDLAIADFGLAYADTDPSVKSSASSQAAAPPQKTTEGVDVDVNLDDVILEEQEPLRRQMTQHVSTRWWRAPELLLLAQEYTSAIDMWSAGCILADLMMMQSKIVSRRSHLFPGHTSLNLSHRLEEIVDYNADQLNVIFSIIGTPSKKVIDSLDISKNSKEFLHSLVAKYPKKRQSLAGYFQPEGGHNIVPLAINLLSGLLTLDPKKRLTAEQALKHPYFKDYFNAQDFNYSIKHITLDYDQDAPKTHERMKNEFFREVLKDNPDKSADYQFFVDC